MHLLDSKYCQKYEFKHIKTIYMLKAYEMSFLLMKFFFLFWRHKIQNGSLKLEKLRKNIKIMK